MNFTQSRVKKVLATICLIAMISTSFISFLPRTANAVVALGVPISTSVDYQSVMNYQKNFTLDRIATLLAKQMLHRLTADVVDWINHGFEGSPAFLNNPGAFFLDAADQVTGAFLAGNGPLSTLCSPFAINLTLSLALSQVSLADSRYTCTLGKIIEAQKNGPDITINGKVINSSKGSMNGFLGGDFNQGGWPAFIALTTEPQNNPYGAFLSAQSDLNARIGKRQNTINANLQLGQGFMSWDKCSNISEGDFIDRYNSNDDSVKMSDDKNGAPVYQSCETQTPGSVIANTLQTNLNVPVKELELANDINAVVNALVTQMMTSMLQKGLGGLSSGSSGSVGGGRSATQQIIDNANSGADATATVNNLQGQLTTALEQVDSYVSLYEQSIKVVNDSEDRYIRAQNCLRTKLANGRAGRSDPEYVKTTISMIEDRRTNEIKPLLSSLNDKRTNAVADRTKLQDISYSLAGTGSAGNIETQLQKYNDFAQSGGLYVQPKIDTAQATLTSTESQAKIFNDDAGRIQSECNQL